MRNYAIWSLFCEAASDPSYSVDLAANAACTKSTSLFRASLPEKIPGALTIY